MIEGIDAAWGRPTPAQLTAAGKHFIIGYVSHDAAKNLSKANCAAYLAAGIAVGLVWETTSDRALYGAKAGGLDGRQARDQARALGFPDRLPIFAAVDFLASVAQLAGPVREYLAAFAAGVGGVDLAGVYGGLDTVRYALNTKLVDWGWQTYAWSGGRWDERAQVRQYRNGVHIAGHDTDLDRATSLAAFWTAEKEITDMPITDAEIEKIARASAVELLGTTLGHSGPTVGVALQSGIAGQVALALSATLPAAVVAALPPVVRNALSEAEVAQIEAAVHGELGKLTVGVEP